METLICVVILKVSLARALYPESGRSADPRCRHVNGLGQPVLADAQGLEELLIEEYTRADG